VEHNFNQEQDLQVPGPEVLANSLRLRDGVLAFLGLVALWLIGGRLLSKAKPFLDTRTLTYLSGFTIQAILALVIMSLSWFKGFKLKDLGYKSVGLIEAAKSVLKAYGLVWVCMILYANALMFFGFSPPEQNTYTFLFSQKGLFIILNLLLAVVFAPIFEETMFRGVIYGSLRSKLGVWPAALLSGAIFSGVHFEVYGFLPRLVLGVLLALLFEKYKSLYPSMCLHATHNGVLFLLALKSVAG
jgi:uncharacterized protein